MRRVPFVLIALAACGDNALPRCELREAPVLPPDGPLADPLAIELPPDCVTGGLSDAAGRWFVRDSESLFEFSYPLFEPTCEGGVRLAGVDDDHDPVIDNRVRHTWWDGTRLYTREYFKFELPEFDFIYEYATAQALCMLPDGTLAGRWAQYQTDFPEIQTGQLVGTRFGRKDEAKAHGLELVGHRRVAKNGQPIVGYNLVVDGGYAYVAGPTGFHIIDVSDPARPQAVAFLDEPWNDVRVVHGNGKTVAIGASFREDATIFVDVTDPERPQVAAKIDSFSHSLQVAGTRLYLADYTTEVPIYDVADPLSPVFLGAAAVPDAEFGIHDLTVDGDRLFVNQTVDGFIAIDTASNVGGAAKMLARIPTSYSHASAVGTTTGGRRLALHGDEGLTGTADGAAFLRVLDGDPASATFLQELGRYATRPEVGIHNIEMRGDRAYIAYYQDGVRVVDVSDPAQPREVAHYNTWDETADGSNAFSGAIGIRVVDGLIYVADSERGLVILRETL
jgi:hypothetical protein